MATVTPPRPTRKLEEDQILIRSPLARLRKYIYSYVSLEGAAQAVLFLALWFWVAMALDYGFFKLFLLDWVQELPWAVRAGVLVVVLAGLLALLVTTMLFRLFRHFSDSTMALVLEKRFPAVLGDRLITAVELSDPQAAAEYGYSPAMVRQTIHDAADRVGQVPLKEVFDWKRLTHRAFLILALTAGGYALAAGAFCVARSVTNQGDPVNGIGDMNEVATILTERNVLLRNTIWPRRSHIEIIPWGESGDLGSEAGVDPETNTLKIPQGSTPPGLRVRAWKYVVADESKAEGWRQLRWDDLKKKPRFAGGQEVPELPADWTGRDGTANLTVDEVELRLEGFPIKRGEDGQPARWTFALPTDESGSRPLLWSDLTKDRLGGLDVPAIPGNWDAKSVQAAVREGAGLIGAGAIGAAARVGMLGGGKKDGNVKVDEIEDLLKQAEEKDANNPAVAAVRKVFTRLEQLLAVQDTFPRLDEAAGQSDLRRVMRKLIVPASVTLTYSSKRSTNTSTMARIADNQFTGNFSELKESVSFTVRGEDYVTPRQHITVVERPRVDTIESYEERPAYLYYRPNPDERDPQQSITASDLRGLRQLVEQGQKGRLSTSGEATTVEVPMGTHFTLTGMVTKPVLKVEVQVEAKDKKTFKTDEKGIEGPLEDGKSFRLRLPDVRREQRFKVVFTDTDHIAGERRFVIMPKEDTTPRVREFNPDEVIRRGRGNEGFIVAVGCRIPFKGRVLDDNGLAKVSYACRVTPADFLSAQKVRSMLGVGALPLFQTPGTILQGVGYTAALTQEIAQLASAEGGPEQFVPVREFEEILAVAKTSDGRDEFLKKDTVLGLLKTKQSEPYRKLLREFILTPDRWTERFAEKEEDEPKAYTWYRADEFGADRRSPPGRSPLACDLPLSLLTWRDKEGKMRPLKDPDITKPQRRFMVEVRLMVEDTYIEGDVDPKTKKPVPHLSPSGESFTFVVVPENELLSRIAEEEEAKYQDMVKAYKPLPENLERLREASFELQAGPGTLNETVVKNIIARCDTLADALKTSHQDVKGVYLTYERILREMRVNQVNDSMMTKVFTKIYKPLQKVSEIQFDVVYNGVVALRRDLDDNTQPLPERVKLAAPKASKAKTELNELIAQLQSVMSAMEGLAKINELIKELVLIEKQEEDLESLVQKLLRRRILDELGKE